MAVQSLADATQDALFSLCGRGAPLVSNRAEARDLIFGGSRRHAGRRPFDRRVAQDASALRLADERRRRVREQKFLRGLLSRLRGDG